MYLLIMIIGIYLRLPVWFWVVYSIVLILKILHWLGCVMQKQEE